MRGRSLAWAVPVALGLALASVFPDGARAGARRSSLSGSLLATPTAGERFDLVLAGGRVVDGTGAPWTRADVGVRGDRIAAIGDLSSAPAGRRIDATGLVVCPGFIDMLGQSEYYLLVDPRAASKITQGITTEITGEGQAIAPQNARMLADGKEVWARYGVTPSCSSLDEYFRQLERTKPAINVATFVGAGGVRNLVIGLEDRPATAAELGRMEEAVSRAMQQGAFGVSTSLQYVPDRFASTEEIIALAKVAARSGGTYITHQRSETHRIDESLDEVFQIAREAHIPAQIYHLKTACRKNWGRMPEILVRIEAARAEGLDVSANQYPYIAGQNGLDANLPLWMREGGKDSLVARLRDPRARERARADMLREDPSWENQYMCCGGPGGILIASAVETSLKPYEGQRLDAIARAANRDPADMLMDIVATDRANTTNIVFIMDDRDVRAALAHPLVAFCTDSPAVAEDGILSQEKSHPRAWGSAARILGHYVRDERVLRLEEAIRKMTSLPASRMGLGDRGVVRPGMFADLVVFDPAAVHDVSTFEDPIHYSQGIPYVTVNGKLVVDGGAITKARPGRVLRGPGWRGSKSR